MNTHDNSAGSTRAGNDAAATELLAYESRESHPQPRYAMIWLHGLGADGFDFVPIAQAMPKVAATGVRYYFPHAPMRPVTVNNGMVMRAWYDITGFDLRRDLDRTGISQSVAQVEALRGQIASQGIPHQNHILAGFSQGGVIALRTALASRQPPLAVLGLSCYLANGEELQQWASAEAAKVPVFIGHGSQDPVVPMLLGERARDWLQQAGYAVQWHAYPIPHSVSPEEVSHIDHWTAQQLVSGTAG